MSEKPFQFSRTFLRDRCDFCGRCFQECPVFGLPLKDAQAEIHALAETGHSRVLDLCTGCMACNSICPRDANPHTLIMNSWEARYKEDGLPWRAGLVLPYQKPNLYTIVREHLPADERAVVEQWEQNLRNPPDSGTMVYAGCNMILQPFLMMSRLFEGIPIFGSLDICCGEPLYRSGCWDAARTAAAHVKREFERMGLKRVIVPCLAGYHLFRHVYPEVFGVSLPCEVIGIEKWLLGRIEGGELTITPLHKRAIIHDNCWPKASGDVLFDTTRTLLARLGITVVEPPHTRELALCCGMCAGAARFRMRDILRALRERLRELDACDGDMIIDYCGGCNWLFALSNRVPGGKARKPVYHLLEVLGMAAGQPLQHRTDVRAGQIVSLMKGKLARRYMTRKRFRIDEVAGKTVDRP